MRIYALCFVVLAGVVACSATQGNLTPAGPLAASARHAGPHAKATDTPSPRCTPGKNTTAFTVKGNAIRLSINGGTKQTFYIKGIDYSPTQIGSTYIEPLDNTNSAVWKRDLPQMAALGANVVRVYNTGMYQLVPGDWYTTPMDKWLSAAYKKGIYTIVEINFSAGAIGPSPNAGAIASLSSQYYRLAEYAGCNPDVMGISIGGEWNGSFVNSKDVWTNGLNKIIAATQQGLNNVGAQKIITTSIVNDMNPSQPMQSTMAYGEKYGFPTGNFVWGYDVYGAMSPVFTGAASVMKKYKQRPLILGEWGESVGYHPYPAPTPTSPAFYPPSPAPVPSAWVVEEWPGSTGSSPSPLPSPAFSAVTAYLDHGAKRLWSQASWNGPSGAPASGGFYFEWSDEWWAGRRTQNGPACSHISGNGDPAELTPASGWPSGFWDNGWFGLNAVSLPSSVASCPPNGGNTPDVITPRLTFTHLQADFAAEKIPPSAGTR